MFRKDGLGREPLLADLRRRQFPRLHEILSLTIIGPALYVGDWDPSGLCMRERDLLRRLREYGANIRLHRIALTRDDVDHGGLPSFAASTKTKDPRYRWFVENYGPRWELDALPPPDLRARVLNATRALSILMLGITAPG